MNETDSEPGGGRRAKPHGLVRPYVLGPDSRARKRPTQREAGGRVTRDYGPTFDWPGDLDSRRPRDARSDPTRRDAPTRQQPTTGPLPARKSAGSHRTMEGGWHHAFRSGWPRALAERRRLTAIGVGVVALAVVGGTVLLLSRPSSKLLATGIGPPTGAATSAHKPIRRSHPTTAHSSARLSPTPTPTPSPTSSPTASPTQQPVHVSYSVVRQHPHSFQGQFTIVNNGNMAIKGWELVVVLPGDDIRSVSNALFHTVGDTLYIDPPRSAQSIAPGATVTENFTAHGSTTTLTSCTFNGSAC